MSATAEPYGSPSSVKEVATGMFTMYADPAAREKSEPNTITPSRPIADANAPPLRARVTTLAPI